MKISTLSDNVRPVALMRLHSIDNPTKATGKIPADKLVVEPKWDGYLVQILFKNNQPTIYTRNGNDITDKFPDICEDLTGIPNNSLLIGELIWMQDGKQSFSKISSLAKLSVDKSLEQQRKSDGFAKLILYDVLWYDDKKVADKSFTYRRNLLEKIIEPTSLISLSPVAKFDQWEKIAKQSVKSGGEGIVIKNVESPYVYAELDEREPKPRDTWWKWKPPEKARTDDFVVYRVRYTDKGTMIVDFGQYYDGDLYHVGSIDSFDGDVQSQIKKIGDRKFVIEVGFEERTDSGKLRHPHFIRIRDDKDPKDVDLDEKYTKTLDIVEHVVDAYNVIFEAVALPQNYPEHPETILIKNDYYPDGLTEYMVWKHNYNHREDFLKQLKNRRTLLIIKADGTIVKRKGKHGVEYVPKSLRDIDDMNTGRTMEFHIVAEHETDVAWIDLDPKEKFSFDDVKPIVKDVVGIMHDVTKSDVQIKYSGGRGFHVMSYMDTTWDVDELRNKLKDELGKYAKSNPKISVGQTKDVNTMRLDVSTLHYSGSIRAMWSTNASTGLVSVPLELDELDNFNKEDAVIALPRKLMFHPFKEDPNSTSGQMRWRLRDPKSFIEGSFVTWKFWHGIHERGLSFIVGKLKQPYNELAVQAIRFSRDVWDENKASKWWENNYYLFDKLWTEADWKKHSD